VQMYDGHGKATYQGTSVLSSSPQRLVQVLYQHLLVNLKRGALCIEQGDIEGKFECLSRASDIVTELLAALDYDAGGELAHQLSGLYRFWLGEVAHGSRDLDARRVKRVADMVASLLEAWEEAARLAVSGCADSTGMTEAT
jgi:flagellar secretion chaperone FliS